MITKESKQQRGQIAMNMFAESKAVFVIDCDRFDSGKTQAFRKKLVAVNGKMMVVKTTILKLIARKYEIAKIKTIEDKFNKQIALVFAKNDVVGVTTLMKEYGFGQERSVYGGIFDDIGFGKEKFEFFASIPAAPVLYARLCGVLKYGVMGKLVNVIHQISEKNNQSV